MFDHTSFFTVPSSKYGMPCFENLNNGTHRDWNYIVQMDCIERSSGRNAKRGNKFVGHCIKEKQCLVIYLDFGTMPR